MWDVKGIKIHGANGFGASWGIGSPSTSKKTVLASLRCTHSPSCLYIEGRILDK